MRSVSFNVVRRSPGQAGAISLSMAAILVVVVSGCTQAGASGLTSCTTEGRKAIGAAASQIAAAVPELHGGNQEVDGCQDDTGLFRTFAVTDPKGAMRSLDRIRSCLRGTDEVGPFWSCPVGSFTYTVAFDKLDPQRVSLTIPGWTTSQ